MRDFGGKEYPQGVSGYRWALCLRMHPGCVVFLLESHLFSCAIDSVTVQRDSQIQICVSGGTDDLKETRGLDPTLAMGQLVYVKGRLLSPLKESTINQTSIRM